MRGIAILRNPGISSCNKLRFSPIPPLAAGTEAARRASELARNEYASGLADFNSVLDAQRWLLAFEEQLAQSRGQVTANLISLYKALGGGWTSLAGAPP